MDGLEVMVADGSIAVNWSDAKYRVLKSYREWLRAVSILFFFLSYAFFYDVDFVASHWSDDQINIEFHFRIVEMNTNLTIDITVP